MTRRALAALACVLLAAQAPAPAPATNPPPAATPPLSPPNTWVPRTAADIQVLDKVNAHATTITLKVGQAADNASLSIALRACMVRPPDLPQDAAAFLDIADRRAGAPGFHGWMFAKEPALSMLENPVYDVRLVACH
ncbi:MAG: DUF2155 domain-containing protein [Acetobacteraceae bacterium]